MNGLQMGHQAAQCKTGTTPWREVFGDEAFVVRKPVFWTEVLAKRAAKVVNHAELEASAKAYARQQCEAQGRNYDESIIPVAEASQSIDTAALLARLRKQAEDKDAKAKQATDPAAGLPPGWNVTAVRAISIHRSQFIHRRFSIAVSFRLHFKASNDCACNGDLVSCQCFQSGYTFRTCQRRPDFLCVLQDLELIYLALKIEAR
jgi:hypothetical protein